MDNIIDKKVTVLMSVYNESKVHLKESIESILNQTYKDFEFLIINDGNNKDLIELVKNYNDDRIRLINNETNIGLAASLNKGIINSKGEYIIRMDADDISYEDRIQKQLEFIEKNSDYAIISGKAEVFDENGIYNISTSVGEVTKNDLIKGNPLVHPTMIIKKDILNKIGKYPNYKRNQDYAMVMNLYANGYKAYIMEDILLKYRMDKNGYKKKKFKYRILEMKIRFKYYNKMNVKVFQYIYVLKPIIVGLIPKFLLKKIHTNK